VGGVNDTADKNFFFIYLFQYSNLVKKKLFANGQRWALAVTPLTSGGRSQRHCWPLVSDVKDTADHWQAVSMTPPINIDTADQGDPTFTRLLFPSKGISIKKAYRYTGKLYYDLQHGLKI
jgi:hypothetical protein